MSFDFHTFGWSNHILFFICSFIRGVVAVDVFPHIFYLYAMTIVFSEFIYWSSYRKICFNLLCLSLLSFVLEHICHFPNIDLIINLFFFDSFYLLSSWFFYFQFWCGEFWYVWELQYAESVAGHRRHGSQLPRFLGAGRVLSAEERLRASNHAGSHPHKRHGTGRSRLYLLISSVCLPVVCHLFERCDVLLPPDGLVLW